VKKLLKILAGLAAVAVLAVYYFTSDDRGTARNFVVEPPGGQIAQAHARPHSSLQTQIPLDGFQASLTGTKPLTEVSFSSIETSGGATTLKRTARTANGCSSEVEFRLLDAQIVAFNITPLCQ